MRCQQVSVCSFQRDSSGCSVATACWKDIALSTQVPWEQTATVIADDAATAAVGVAVDFAVAVAVADIRPYKDLIRPDNAL